MHYGLSYSLNWTKVLLGAVLLAFRQKIDFAVIGFPKCATTSIHRNLLACPEVVMPSHEVRMRDLILGKVCLPKGNYKRGIKNPNLIYDPSWIRALSLSNPKIKFILCLRNPSDWLFSFHQYRVHEIKSGRKWLKDRSLEPHFLSKISFEELTETGISFHGASTAAGEFDRAMEAILDFLSPKNIHVIILEDLAKYPSENYSRIFEFLKIKPNFTGEPIQANRNSHIYEDRALYDNEFALLDDHYAPHRKRINDILKRYWGIYNDYWK